MADAFYRGTLAGDGNKDWEFGGKGDIIVTLDGERLGLWSGFFVTAHLELNYGNDILHRSTWAWRSRASWVMTRSSL